MKQQFIRQLTGQSPPDPRTGRNTAQSRRRVPLVIAAICGTFALTIMGVGAAQPDRDGAAYQPYGSTGDLYLGYSSDGYPGISYPSEALVLGFVRPGVIGEITVEENDVVEPGQLLGRQRDAVQAQVVEAAQISAEDETELAAATVRFELATFEYENQQEAFDKDAASPRELERARVEMELRQIDVAAAKRNRLQAQAAYQRELAVLEDMKIFSRIRGRVIRIQHEEGEAVDGLEPVFHIVANDPLWMDVDVPVPLAMHVKAGTPVEVAWRDLPETEPSAGRVLFVSPIVDSAANRMLVRLEIPNPTELPVGLHALVRFPVAEDELREARR